MSFNTRLKRSPRAKVILGLCFFCSAGFIILQNENQIVFEEPSPENNYGVDCKLFEKAMKDDEQNLIQDTKIVFEHSSVYRKEPFTLQHRPLLNCMDQDFYHLTDVIRDEFLVKPDYSINKLVLNSEDSVELDTFQQTKDIVDMIFKEKKGGFFIEAGGFDCEDSITLPLEHNYNWTGLLVEALPVFFDMCKKVGRKSHLINTCLATQNKPHFADFNLEGELMWEYFKENSTGIKRAAPGFVSNLEKEYKYQDKSKDDFYKDNSKSKSSKLQCLPLYSILLALGNPTVNLFVLDIEGFELAILETIPWDKVDIEVLDIETDLAGLFQKDSSREKIINLMDKNGYVRFDHRDDYNTFTNKNKNDLFVRKDIVRKYNVKQI